MYLDKIGITLIGFGFITESFIGLDYLEREELNFVEVENSLSKN